MFKHVKFRATHWVTTAAMVLGLGVAIPVATAPAASAATSCSGTLIDQINHYDYTKSSHPHVATTYLYWDGTYNCAKSVKAGSYYGVSSRMNLDLWTKAGGHANDSGTFLYSAGPIKVNGKGTCINFELDMWRPNGGTNFLQDHVPYSGYFHCG
ncbi:hypothetical protein GTW43_08490 [Streptomyces sp. SID5785]|uniref:hypothetical protein n=1 Tax=Streptomyces sp. SID5785 TaxID=2690309 RepID=UPI001361AD8B|nr:hypothetical protein [Streptomyces sp. SID5785]MZD05122.1 hypothetical protein [Streptomyces sp. SID5785]